MASIKERWILKVWMIYSQGKRNKLSVSLFTVQYMWIVSPVFWTITIIKSDYSKRRPSAYTTCTSGPFAKSLISLDFTLWILTATRVKVKRHSSVRESKECVLMRQMSSFCFLFKGLWWFSPALSALSASCLPSPRLNLSRLSGMLTHISHSFS